jgi:flagellar assembly protein FliH
MSELSQAHRAGHRDPAGEAAEAQLTAYQRWEMASFDPAPRVDPELLRRQAQERAAAKAAQAALDAEIAALREQAYNEGLAAGHVAGQALGYQAGHEQGLAQGRVEAQREADGLRALADSFRAALSSADHEMAETLTSLALDVARQVIRQDIALDPSVLLAAAREVIGSEPALTGQPQLIVNPADQPLADAYLREELERLGWSLRTDASIERGGCRAKASSGEVDATLPTRWERVAAALGRNLSW